MNKSIQSKKLINQQQPSNSNTSANKKSATTNSNNKSKKQKNNKQSSKQSQPPVKQPQSQPQPQPLPAQQPKQQPQQPLKQQPSTQQPSTQQPPQHIISHSPNKSLDNEQWTQVSKKSSNNNSHRLNNNNNNNGNNSSEIDHDAWSTAQKLSSNEILDSKSTVYTLEPNSWKWSEHNSMSKANPFNIPISHNEEESHEKQKILRIPDNKPKEIPVDDGWTVAGSNTKQNNANNNVNSNDNEQQVLSKKQRQNLKKKEAKNAQTAAKEVVRQDTLKQYKSQQQPAPRLTTSSKNPWEVLTQNKDTNLIWD